MAGQIAPLAPVARQPLRGALRAALQPVPTVAQRLPRHNTGFHHMLLHSLAFQTRSGFISRGCPGSAVWLACHAARQVIRQAGFTLAQAWAASTGHWHAGHLPTGFNTVEQLASARAVWHRAERVARSVYREQAKAGQPPALNLRLVLAFQQRRGQ